METTMMKAAPTKWLSAGCVLVALLAAALLLPAPPAADAAAKGKAKTKTKAKAEPAAAVAATGDAAVMPVVSDATLIVARLDVSAVELKTVEAWVLQTQKSIGMEGREL